MSEAFDQLTRQIGQARSRREALRVLGTGLLGVAFGSLVGKKALAQDPAGTVPRSIRGFPPQPLNPGLPPATFDPRQPLGPPRPLPPGPIRGPLPFEPVGKTCSSALLTDCLATAQAEYTRCAAMCNAACGPGEQYPDAPRTAVCSACRRQWPDCRYTLQEAGLTCQKTYGCINGYSCNMDEARPQIEYCCPTGKVPCNGGCVDPCLSLAQIRNRSTCQCDCARSCRPPMIQGTDCLCKCPECKPGFRLQDTRTCKCTCIDGLDLCGDECVSLQINRKHCGACGTECGPQEECCLGQCVSTNEDPNCGRCFNNCSAIGQTCCPRDLTDVEGVPLHPRAYCSDLNYVLDCGECGKFCPSGECCKGVCCTSHVSSCCNGNTCISLNTIQNCGSCGRRCASGEACCNGVCTRLGTNDNCRTCGDVCQPATTWVTIGTGAVISTVASSCKSRQCTCPPNSALCDNFCAPDGWFCNGHTSDGKVRISRCPDGKPTGREWGTGRIICCPGTFTFIGDNRVCT